MFKKGYLSTIHQSPIDEFINYCRQHSGASHVIDPNKFTIYSLDQLRKIQLGLVNKLTVNMLSADIITLMLHLDGLFIFQLIQYKLFGRIIHLLNSSTNLSARNENKETFLFHLKLDVLIAVLKSTLQFDINCQNRFKYNILMSILRKQSIIKIPTQKIESIIDLLVIRNFNFNHLWNGLSLLSFTYFDISERGNLTRKLIGMPQCNITQEFWWLRRIIENNSDVVQMSYLFREIMRRPDAPQFLSALISGYTFSNPENTIIDIMNYLYLSSPKRWKKMVVPSVIELSHTRGYRELSKLLSSLN